MDEDEKLRKGRGVGFEKRFDIFVWRRPQRDGRPKMEKDTHGRDGATRIRVTKKDEEARRKFGKKRCPSTIQ